ncbi:hypothetical protein HZ994_12695 [Akkermansiaceae bacterium]|nr:hypothetical protein HZ994_12695 [Akkermansiaceae bacterium]
MKSKLIISTISAAAAAAASAGGLYIPNDAETSVPIAWSVGVDAIWDDNTTPGLAGFDGDESFSLNPFVGVSFVSVTPQTTLDVYARLGVIYYIDDAPAMNDDTFGQARVGVNLTHRFNERLRFTSRNFLAYELEPDLAQGFASNRVNSEYLYWQTDNSIGYRWTERFATYTGFQLTGLEYDNIPDGDRFTWTAYNQFRYQLSPQSVLTASYRYSETDGSGRASDSTNQYLLMGIEHRFSPNTILIANAGAQLRDVSGPGGSNSTNPYLELALRSQVNTQFSIRGFVRYGAEDYDTVVALPAIVEYDERLTLRVGVSGEYQLSPSLSLFGGVDLITTSYESGRLIPGPGGAPDADETLVNAYIGASLKFTEYLYGTLSYNFTNADSDVVNRSYDRNRISLGLRAEF